MLTTGTIMCHMSTRTFVGLVQAQHRHSTGTAQAQAFSPCGQPTYTLPHTFFGGYGMVWGGLVYWSRKRQFDVTFGMQCIRKVHSTFYHRRPPPPPPSRHNMAFCVWPSLAEVPCTAHESLTCIECVRVLHTNAHSSHDSVDADAHGLAVITKPCHT